jgi:hypothetical protein
MLLPLAAILVEAGVSMAGRCASILLPTVLVLFEQQAMTIRQEQQLDCFIACHVLVCCAQELEAQLEAERGRAAALRGELSAAQSAASETVSAVGAERAALAAELENERSKVSE